MKSFHPAPCIRRVASIIALRVAPALVVMAMTGISASAALIAYDGFEEYTEGDNLNAGSSGSGWTSGWSTDGNHTTIQAGGLADPNGTVNGGSQVARLRPTADLADVANFMSRTFTSTTSDVYVSFLVRNGGGVDNGDFYNFQVSDGATGNSRSALGVGIRNAQGNPFFARVGDSGAGSQTTNSSINATVDMTFLLVAKFSKDGGSSTYNRTELFINPGGSEPASPDAVASSGVTGLSSLSLFTVRNFSPESGDTVFIDELRVGTTFADVIPEPSAASLAMLSVIGLLFTRRRVHMA